MLHRPCPGRCRRPGRARKLEPGGFMSIRHPQAPPARRMLASLAVFLAGAALHLLPAASALAADDASTSGSWAIDSWSKQDSTTEYWLSLRWTRGHDHWGSRSIPLARVPG